MTRRRPRWTLALALSCIAVVACSRARLGEDFTLESASGPVSLHDFRGKVALVYFGYASCPDVCPTSLSLWAKALTSLRADELARVQPIFISVDPDRDSPANLQKYASFFHPSILGVTGAPAELSRIALVYGASFSKVPSSSGMGYSVDHTAETYVVGTDGALLGALAHDAPPDAIASAIRTALAKDHP